MTTKTITVTQEHWDHGLRALASGGLRVRWCVMAWALRDAFPDEADDLITSGVGTGYVGEQRWRYDDTGYNLTRQFDCTLGGTADAEPVKLPAQVTLTLIEALRPGQV